MNNTTTGCNIRCSTPVVVGGTFKESISLQTKVLGSCKLKQIIFSSLCWMARLIEPWWFWPCFNGWVISHAVCCSCSRWSCPEAVIQVLSHIMGSQLISLLQFLRFCSMHGLITKVLPILAVWLRNICRTCSCNTVFYRCCHGLTLVGS